MRGAEPGREASSEKAAADLPAPDVWTWERFAVVPAGGEYIALHNTHHNRFIRMTSSVVDSSGVTNLGASMFRFFGPSPCPGLGMAKRWLGF